MASPEFFQFEPEVAARTFEKAPEKCFFPLASFPAQFGLSREETLEELRSGRLKASGTPNERGGYTAIAISAKALLDWLAIGSPAALKAAASILRK